MGLWVRGREGWKEEEMRTRERKEQGGFCGLKIPVVMILGFDWVDRSRGTPRAAAPTNDQARGNIADDEPMMNAEKKELGPAQPAMAARQLFCESSAKTVVTAKV